MLHRAKRLILALACAGIPLVTVGTCDPYTGAFDFFRDDDNDYYYDGYYYYDDYYYDDYYDDGYYYYYDDCYDCW